MSHAPAGGGAARRPGATLRSSGARPNCATSCAPADIPALIPAAAWTSRPATEWPAAARSLVAILHVDAGRHLDDPQLAALIADLSQRDDDFRRWWTSHDVLNNTHGTRLYHHPLVGSLTLDYEVFSPAGDEDQRLILHTAKPGSPSELGLHQLARWVTPASFPPRQNPPAHDS